MFELWCDKTLHSEFKRHSLTEFWIQRNVEYSELADRAVHFLMSFAMVYLYEVVFLSLVTLESKSRSRMNSECDLRLKLINIMPNIKEFHSTQQAHSLN